MEDHMEETARRINNIEIAITELTTLNKSQEATASRQANSIEKILGHLQDMAVLRAMVNNAKEDIDKLGAKVDHIHTEISIKEDAMQKQINENKEELSSSGSNRLIKGVVIAAAISTFLFGYLYLDFHRAERVISLYLKEVTAEIKANHGKLISIEKTMDVYKHKHNETTFNHNSKKYDTTY